MEIKKLHQLFLRSKGITTDTRKIGKGQLFFALKGDNFNGNTFAKTALEQGAAYAVVDELEYAVDEQFIFVENVLKCLQDLAQFHRKFLALPIIAITGTNGKTTTKELVSAVLKRKYHLGFTQGNLNNHIGVPLTLLSFTKETELGVVEMGANHPGEIKQLCEIALPDYGIITNIGKAHIEGFGSFEGVINTKSELYNYLKINHKSIFVNGDDDLLVRLSEELIRYKYGKQSDFYVNAEFVEASPFLNLKWKNHLINTQLVGEYNINNVLAAICVGVFFKVSEAEIIKAIGSYRPQNNRSQLTKTAKNTLIIDAYNANPTSMELAVRNFLNIKDKEKVLILGDMFELGDSSEEEHQKIVKLVQVLGFTEVYFIGSNFFKLHDKLVADYHFFENIQMFCDYASENEISGKTILLKASRGIRLEKVIEFL